MVSWLGLSGEDLKLPGALLHFYIHNVTHVYYKNSQIGLCNLNYTLLFTIHLPL